MATVKIHIVTKGEMVELFAEEQVGSAFHMTIWNTVFKEWEWDLKEFNKYQSGHELCSFMINSMDWTKDQNQRWWREWKNPDHPLYQRIAFVATFDCPYFRIETLERVIKALETFWEDIVDNYRIHPTILNICDRLKELQERSDVLGFFIAHRDAEYFYPHENRVELPTVEGLSEVYLGYRHDFVTLEDIREQESLFEANQVFLVEKED